MRLVDADDLYTVCKEVAENDCLTDGAAVEVLDIVCEAMANTKAIDAVEVVWHKVTTRPLTAEEAEYYATMELDGIEYIFDCEMPDDGQEILIATKWGTDKDICSYDAEYGIGLEGRGDWEGVCAWAEMPKYEVKE